jgi:RNA polymerase sigma-70 factor, ECF subfamily
VIFCGDSRESQIPNSVAKVINVEQKESSLRVVLGTSQSNRSPESILDPERWIDEHGDVLFGFAALRVRSRTIAHDLVQETFLAAIKAKSSFGGRSSERAWLFGILRNKLTDYYRLQGREVLLADLDTPLPEERNAFDAAGVGKDGWLEASAPKAWDTPEEALVSKEFQEVLTDGLSHLPAKIAQVFSLREIDGLSSEQI